VPRAIQERIRSWGFSRAALLSLLNAIHLDLPERFDSLMRLAAPNPTHLYFWDFTEEGDPPRQLTVTLWVGHGEEEDTLEILDAALTDAEDDLGEE
jgi:hypothetical protein